MKLYQLIFLTLSILLVLFVIWKYYQNSKMPTDSTVNSQQINNSLDNSNKKTMALTISSPNFNYGELISPKYTCDGENMNPELIFQNVPEETNSLVLIVDDPDAPVGTFTHWILFNISPETTRINENSVPAEAKKGLNDFGKVQYNGPCPPGGIHRYFFRLYALDKTLDLPDGSTRGEIEKQMQNSIVSTAEYMGKYQRQ